MAIGSRSQTSRTYLEREYKNFSNCSKDELIKHTVKALAVSLAGDSELDCKSVSVSVIGVDCAFHTIEGAELQKYIDVIEVDGPVAVENEDILETPDI